MSFRITGMGTQAPKYSLNQAETARVASRLCCTSDEQERLLSVLSRRTRIKRRSSVLLEESGGVATHDFFRLPRTSDDRGPGTKDRMGKFEEYAGKMGLGACRKALRTAQLTGEEVTHLITVSCTGFYAPGVDYEIITSLGLPPSVERTQIGFMGCQAALNALRVASSLCAANASAQVLICSVELCSLHFQYGWDPNRIVSNSIFADGAGAIVGTGDGGDNPDCWRILGNGSYLVPNSADAMTWKIGDHGFDMTLSARVPDLIDRHLADWLDKWLAGYGLRRSEIGSWAIHPGGPRILVAAERALGISSGDTQVSRNVLTNFGNMSSATMFFVLEQLIGKQAPLPCVALGFGPGLTIEAALFGAERPKQSTNGD
jgi:predicted naringenin-chalcone synthase